ncbi:MAG: hypothetical protein MZV70_17155 [Desulfobacterales bacterium]|nr:hypothetical protein [Desulfobacterales bacterium]
MVRESRPAGRGAGAPRLDPARGHLRLVARRGPHPRGAGGHPPPQLRVRRRRRGPGRAGAPRRAVRRDREPVPRLQQRGRRHPPLDRGAVGRGAQPRPHHVRRGLRRRPPLLRRGRGGQRRRAALHGRSRLRDGAGGARAARHPRRARARRLLRIDRGAAGSRRGAEGGPRGGGRPGHRRPVRGALRGEWGQGAAADQEPQRPLPHRGPWRLRTRRDHRRRQPPRLDPAGPRAVRPVSATRQRNPSAPPVDELPPIGSDCA